jgi:GNAT superfamily N-acetyltransferase
MMRTRLVDTSRPEIRSALVFLQAQLFPQDEALEPIDGYWWVTWDGDVPAAFAAMRHVPSWPNTFYMARCGVLTKYRGMGLQRKMLTLRERMARDLGARRLITTTYRNPKSANNLIARGFLTYEPQTRWGAADTIYWIKDLAP